MKAKHFWEKGLPTVTIASIGLTSPLDGITGDSKRM